MNLNIPLKKVTLPSGVTYGYVYNRPVSLKPTLLFLHGFPSAVYDWRHQISYFSNTGYGVMAPDLLGYGSSDKPLDIREYKGKKMASEIIEILDHENISKVHGVGHDWGSFLLSRLANYYPERFYSYAFLDIAYMPPGLFDIEAAEADSIKQVGYERLGFWRFFMEDDAGEILKDHFDSFHSLFYPADPAIWKDHLGPSGAMRRWLEVEKIGSLASYLTADEKETHRQIFGDDYTAPLRWFKAYIENINDEDEKAGDVKTRLELPVLLITANKDIVASAQIMEAGIRQFADDVRVEEVNTGHWVHLEAKNEVNAYLEAFFTDLQVGID